MSKQTSLMNKPETADMVELAYGLKKVEWIPDTRFPLCGTFIVHLEDHTFGSLIKYKLSKDDRVVFVGYRMPHPLENKLEIRLRTKIDNPFIVILNNINNLKNNIVYLKNLYLTTLKDYNK